MNVKKECKKEHRHLEKIALVAAKEGMCLSDMCVACAYEYGFEHGYNAAFELFEQRVENLIFNWDLAPITAVSSGNGKRETEKEKNSSKDNARTHRRCSESGSISFRK